MAQFIAEVKKEDGQEHARKTLYEILLVFRRFYVWNIREIYYISYIVPKNSITKKRDVINFLLTLVFSVRTVNFGPLFFCLRFIEGKNASRNLQYGPPLNPVSKKTGCKFRSLNSALNSPVKEKAGQVIGIVANKANLIMEEQANYPCKRVNGFFFWERGGKAALPYFGLGF